MKVDIKDYGTIGVPRLLNLKIYKIDYEDLINNNFQNAEVIYEGKSEEIPEEIANMHYYKITLGNPTVYYVVEK